MVSGGYVFVFFFFQAEDGIRDDLVTGVQTCSSDLVALHQDGKFAEAEESYRRAVQAELGYALAHNNLGVALYHRGDGEQAIAAFRVALDAQPTFTKARLNLALLLSKGKRFQ